jgi:hypothetical protein
MKLALAAVIALLALPSLAAAENGQRGRNPERRAALIARFDANGDGRLQPQEKRAAKQAIRAKRAMRVQRFIARFDANGDGNLGPGELPPEKAHKLRKFDRDGDGWVRPNELRPRGMRGQRGPGMRRDGMEPRDDRRDWDQPDDVR